MISIRRLQSVEMLCVDTGFAEPLAKASNGVGIGNGAYHSKSDKLLRSPSVVDYDLKVLIAEV